MAKNILIFSDGTGQAGGLRPDQRLSNVYKLFRATRIGPDSPINPSDQIAFYDPGLGSGENSGPRWLSPVSSVRKIFSQATGGGISRNIADCYEAILKYYQDGDRIYLFGFSRGGYTARCVANVIALCGVPTKNADGSPLPRGGPALRAIAEEAVYKVYDHCAGRKSQAYANEQIELARRFRVAYGSEHISGEAGRANVSPYFIGVFDAVSALGMSWVIRTFAIAISFIGAVAVSSALAGVLATISEQIPFRFTVIALTGLIGLWAIWTFLRSQVKIIKHYPSGLQFRWHFAIWRAKNDQSDAQLDDHVTFARHALAIDEHRASFARVSWGRRSNTPDRTVDGKPWFVQMWFAGNHSDIGGSYPEDESRLSDIALGWMLDEATSIAHPIIVDRTKLNLFPDALGEQHCEVENLRQTLYPRWMPFWMRASWPKAARFAASGAPRHASVDERFTFAAVNHFGEQKSYRPLALIYDPALGESCRQANTRSLPANWKDIVALVKAR